MNLRDLEVFASMDWGYRSKGDILWWACLPDGQYHICYEYPFQGKTVEYVGREIRKITDSLRVARLRYVAADPAMWQKTGSGRGESIAETLLRMRIPMRRSDNDRYNGWMRVRELLSDRDEHGPWLTVSPQCKYLIRTLPVLVGSKNDPEDLDTEGDDHAADALRYGAMSRPRPTTFSTHVTVAGPGTAGELLREAMAGERAVLGSRAVRRRVA